MRPQRGAGSSFYLENPGGRSIGRDRDSLYGSSMSSTGRQLQPQFLYRRAPAAAQLISRSDPLASIGTLLLSTALFEVRFQGPYLILALLVFSLTFPGSVLKLPA